MRGKPWPARKGWLAPVREFGLRREDFHAVIDGMEMDVVTDIRAPDDATLDTYCDRVASAVGRLSVRVFGMDGGDGIALAHHLGRALQLTNILRDLDEDAAFGRLYLPRRRCARLGSPPPIRRRCWRARRSAIVCAQRGRARARPFRGSRHDHGAQPASRRCARRASWREAYRLILDSLVARGWSRPRRPIRLPRVRLVWIIMRHAFI